MKKITLIIACVLFSLNSFAQLPETFDTEIPATWAVFAGANGEGTAQTWQHNANGYVFCQYEAVTTVAEDWLVTPLVSITPATSVLTFDWTKAYAAEYNSTYSVRVSTASQTTHADFTTVQTYTESDAITELQFQPASVDLSAYNGQSVYIAFVLTQNDGDNMFLDNVDLVANATAPDAVTTPLPADGAVDVFVDPTDSDLDSTPDNAVAFDWTPATTGDAATSYDVYLGDSPTTLNLLGNTPNDNVNITGMEYATLYYWQIVARNVGGEAVGSSTWSFTTEDDPNLSVEDFDNNKINVSYNSNLKALNLESNSAEFTSVEVYDILGKQVLSKSLNSNQETINLNNINNGVYITKVSTANGVRTLKFVKN